MLRGSLGDIAHVGATLPSGSDAQSFLWELVMTAFLMFVIMAVATDTRAVGEAAAIAIGGTIGLDVDVWRPDLRRLDESRALARPRARLSGELHALWIYLLLRLPVLRSAAVTYQLVRGKHGGAYERSTGCEASVNSRNSPVTR